MTKIPEGYRSSLSLYDTQKAIEQVKNVFLTKLCAALKLSRVTAPLIVDTLTGMNDNLNGVEHPVAFDLPNVGKNAEVVQSLAKWKRYALWRYNFAVGRGLVCDMNAIRRDEHPDNLHSIYVDQWDWEKVIRKEDRNIKTLEDTVKTIFKVIKHMEHEVWYKYPDAVKKLPEEIYFIDSEELLKRYPNLSPKERENAITKEHGCVFIQRIGDKLSNGEPHDGRAPDYDDWSLNGDILFWFETLNCALEISSMGIRVDEKALERQLKLSHNEDRAKLPYHKMLLEGKLPQTIGGGIGQSRLCMLLLDRAHVGEVQASIWPEDMRKLCEENNIFLL